MSSSRTSTHVDFELALAPSERHEGVHSLAGDEGVLLVVAFGRRCAFSASVKLAESFSIRSKKTENGF